MSRFLIEHHQERLQQVQNRLVAGCEECEKLLTTPCNKHLLQFSQMLPYLLANIPVHELGVLTSGEIYEKQVREFNPVERTFSEDKEAYKDFLTQYISKLDTSVIQNGYSFVFYGYNGSGKTQTSLHVLASAIELGMTGYYIFFKDLINMYTKGAFQGDGESSALYRYIMDCDFLVIDEVGKESSVTENLLGAFEHIIKHRTGMSKPTILLTNINFVDPNDGFAAKYKNSVYNSILQFYKVIAFSKDGDFRARLRKEWDL